MGHAEALDSKPPTTSSSSSSASTAPWRLVVATVLVAPLLVLAASARHSCGSRAFSLQRLQQPSSSSSSDSLRLLQLAPGLANITQLAAGRPISIKVGVFAPEERPADSFFIGLDPTVAAQQSNSQLILPFAAAPVAARELPFYLHEWGGCSSTLMPHGRTDAQRPAFIAAGVAACEAVARELPPSNWRSNDYTYPDEASFRASFPAAANACFVCGDYRNITGVRRFKAVALADVVELLPAVDLLDIDAQGLDVAMLLSLGSLAGRVQRVKLECQVGDTWLYSHVLNGAPVPANNCTAAQEFLARFGFACTVDVNNCACRESNLVCHKAASGLR